MNGRLGVALDRADAEIGPVMGASARLNERRMRVFEALAVPVLLSCLFMSTPASGQCGGWADLGPGPTARKYGAMVYDSRRDRVVLIGGALNSTNLGTRETWEFDGAAWSLRSTSGPSGTVHAAFDESTGVTVAFHSDTTSNETWEWDGDVWSNVTPSLPTDFPKPAGSGSMAVGYDPARQTLVLIGGEDCLSNCGPGVTSKIWEWTGTYWAEADPSWHWELRPPPNPSNTHYWVQPVRPDAPASRYFSGGSTIAYDGALGGMLIAGATGHCCDGVSQHPFQDSWKWNGAAWFQYGNLPNAMWNPALVAFGQRNTALVIGTGVPTTATPGTPVWEMGADGTWQQRTAAGTYAPGPRYGFCVCYDSLRQRVLLFGGAASATGTIGMSDLWAWTMNDNCPADFNCSGTLTVQDVFDFLAAYFQNNTRADFNASGSISVQDIFDFLAAYFAGCP